MVWSIFFFSEIIFFHVESPWWGVAGSIWRASCSEYIDVHSFAIFAPTLNMTHLSLLALFCEISKYQSWLWIGEALVGQYLEHIPKHLRFSHYILKHLYQSMIRLYWGYNILKHLYLIMIWRYWGLREQYQNPRYTLPN